MTSRRRYIASVAAITPVALSGCSSDSSSSDQEQSSSSDQEQSCTDENSEQYCQTHEVLYAIEEQMDEPEFPEIMSVGAEVKEDGNVDEDNGMMNFLVNNEYLESGGGDGFIGALGGAFAGANSVHDHPIKTLHFIYNISEETRFAWGSIRRSWAKEMLNDEMTQIQYITNIRESVTVTDEFKEYADTF